MAWISQFLAQLIILQQFHGKILILLNAMQCGECNVIIAICFLGRFVLSASPQKINLTFEAISCIRRRALVREIDDDSVKESERERDRESERKKQRGRAKAPQYKIVPIHCPCVQHAIQISLYACCVCCVLCVHH